MRISTFTEPAALPGEAPWGRFTATPLHRYPFSVRLIDLDLDGVLLEIGRSTPMAVIGAMPPDTAALLLPLDGHEGMVVNGGRVERQSVAVGGAGVEYELASRAVIGWALVTLPSDRVGTLAFPPAGSAIRRPHAMSLLRADAAAWDRAVTLVQEVAEVTAQDSAVFDAEEARRSLRAGLLGAVHELLVGPWCGLRPRRLRIAPAGRRRIVRAMDRQLQADPARMASPVALAAAVGVPEVGLRSASLAVLGMRPGRFLLLRRLVMVRAVLRSPGPRWQTAREAALTHGFARYGAFLRAYQLMFGEDPPGR